MSRRTYPTALAFLLLCCLGPGTALQAQVVTYTWTGNYDGNSLLHPGNWLAGVPPVPDLENTRLVFANARPMHVDYSEIFANQLKFEGAFGGIELHGSWDTTHIGSGGIIHNPSGPVASFLNDAVQLHATQTWNIANGTFAVEGPISDFVFEGETSHYEDHGINKTGAGTLELRHSESGNWSGGLTLSAGRVVVRPYFDYYEGAYYTSALGFGTLTFNGGTLVATDEDYQEGAPVLIANDIVSNGLISTESQTELVLGYQGEGTSEILLAADTTIRNTGKPLFLSGFLHDAEGARKLTIDSDGAVIIDGPTNWTGGTHVAKGVLIFAGEDNTPGQVGGIQVDALGYAGISTEQNVGLFVSEISVSSTGTIGFDSDPDGESDTFFDPIDLTGKHADLRIGSATHAILGHWTDGETTQSAVITPQGNSYRFGGGGGRLEVQSPLENGETPRNVVLDSPAELPLLVYFTNPLNDFTGGVSATQSGAVFAPGALPEANIFTLGTGGYIGAAGIVQSEGGQTQDYINRFAANTDRGMIGFDSVSETTTITDPIDLSGFTDADPGIYLGTATAAILAGPITPQGNTFRFGAYKGGELTVDTNITGAGTAVHVGDPHSFATMGDANEDEYSTVYLRGDNSYGGTTTLYAGRLLVGQTNPGIGESPTTALGTGALVVQPHQMSLPPGMDGVFPELRLDSGVILPNDIQLNTNLYMEPFESDFTLAGDISGAGGLIIEGDYAVIRLTGNNSFSGGMYLSGAHDLVLGSNTAAGTGPLGFGLSSSTQVFLDTSAPVIGGLYRDSEDDYATFYANVDNTILTINQASDAAFAGEFRSEVNRGALRLVKDGPGALYLEYGGLYVYDGVVEPSLPGTPEVTLQVNAGTLVFGNEFYVGETNTNSPESDPPITPTVFWVNGGTLAVDEDAHVYNPLVVSSGALGGHGFFASASIGANARLTPGFAANIGEPIGILSFNDLTLGSGGLLEWNLRTADPLAGDHDLINIYGAATLHVTATADDPETPGDERFTLRLISLQPDGTPGIVTGFSGERSYTWTIFDATTSAIEGFDPTKFTVDASLFLADLPAHAFTLHQEGNLIQLTFQPVPEPSTYALLAIGLGMVVLAYRRRFSPRRSS